MILDRRWSLGRSCSGDTCSKGPATVDHLDATINPLNKSLTGLSDHYFRASRTEKASGDQVHR